MGEVRRKTKDDIISELEFRIKELESQRKYDSETIKSQKCTINELNNKIENVVSAERELSNKNEKLLKSLCDLISKMPNTKTFD